MTNNHASNSSNCIVEVFEENIGNEKQLLGMGCLVSSELIITCNHIFEQSVELYSFLVDFPTSKTKDCQRVEKIFTRDQDDIAILKLEGKPPNDVCPARFSSLESVPKGSEFKTYGTGGWIVGSVVGMTDNRELIQLNAKSDFKVLVKGGISGSVVWIDNLDSAIGIIKEIISNNQPIKAITSETILKTLSYFVNIDPNIVGVQRIISVDERRKSPRKDPSFFRNAKNIKILGTSLRSFWEPDNLIVKRLIEEGMKGAKIEIFLLHQASNYAGIKAKDENVNEIDYRFSIKESIYKFYNIKHGYPYQMELLLYDEYPIWHMIICNCECGKISYYPKGDDAKNRPYYVFKQGQNQTLLEPLCLHLEQLKKRSIKCTWQGDWSINPSNMSINLKESDVVPGSFSSPFNNGSLIGNINMNELKMFKYVLSGEWKRGCDCAEFDFTMNDDFKSFHGCLKYEDGRKEECNGERIYHNSERII
jgi:hypothetical protein